MTVPLPLTSPAALIRYGFPYLPAVITQAGERAARRFVEFFTANIRNKNTRLAYTQAVDQFLNWCDTELR